MIIRARSKDRAKNRALLIVGDEDVACHKVALVMLGCYTMPIICI